MLGCQGRRWENRGCRAWLPRIRWLIRTVGLDQESSHSGMKLQTLEVLENGGQNSVSDRDEMQDHM